MDVYARTRGGRLADLADSVAIRIGFSRMECQNSVKTQVVGLNAEPNNNCGTKTLERQKNGAGHGTRTRDIQLGKLALYQLS